MSNLPDVSCIDNETVREVVKYYIELVSLVSECRDVGLTYVLPRKISANRKQCRLVDLLGIRFFEGRTK